MELYIFVFHSFVLTQKFHDVFISGKTFVKNTCQTFRNIDARFGEKVRNRLLTEENLAFDIQFPKKKQTSEVRGHSQTTI